MAFINSMNSRWAGGWKRRLSFGRYSVLAQRDRFELRRLDGPGEVPRWRAERAGERRHGARGCCSLACGVQRMLGQRGRGRDCAITVARPVPNGCSTQAVRTIACQTHA